MANYQIHTLDSAPSGSRSAMEQLQSQIGFVPNLAAKMAESPVMIGAFTTLQDAYGSSTLSPLERELILLVTAVEYGNVYGVAVHSTVAKALGVSAQVLTELRDRRDGSDSRLAAIARLARCGARGEAVADNDIEVAGLYGLTNRELLDVMTGVSIGKLVALMYTLAPDTPLEEAFLPHAWSAPPTARG
jgi:alkylhydroperoxidase family enzyme